MSDFEDRVRRALRTDVPGAGSEQLLVDIHHGAGRRKRRRAAAAVAVSALVVAGVAGIAFQLRGDESVSPSPPPTTPVPTTPSQPDLPDGATRGVVDASVVSADRWYRLTANVNCDGCSTVWQNEQSAEGGWERLHDFPSRDRATVASGPVADLVMAANGVDGWAWGEQLYSTHDGGRTWTEVTVGPGRVNGDFGHQVGIADAARTAWSLLRTDQGTELWRTSVGSDRWVRVDAPNMYGVSGMLTLSDHVLLETSDEGLSGPRLQYFRYGDGLPWGEVANPCPGENQVSAATSVAFILCPSGKGATVYRLVGVDHPTAGEPAFQWHEFGRSSGAVTAVHAIDDRHLLVVGERGKATLLTDAGGTVDALASSTAVDLGLEPGEETGSASSSGGLTMVTTFGGTAGNRLIGSTDGGRTWHEVK